MTGDTFFKTRMGQTFFRSTLPDLVHGIQTLSSQIKSLHSFAERWLAQHAQDTNKPPPIDAVTDDSAKTVYIDTVYIGTRVQPIHGQRVRVCGVFRDHKEVAVDFVGADRPPARVHRWSEVSSECWAYVAAFSPKGWMSPTLDPVSVRDLECFAHLSSLSKGQP